MKTVAVVLMGLCAAVGLRGDARHDRVPTAPGHFAAAAPPIMIWAWEEPEDLRGIDPRRVGVAFLAERVFLERVPRVKPRRQRILAPDGVYAVAVVRLEAGRGFVDSNSLRTETTDAVLRAAALPGLRGVQVDFDATDSQREFYADVMRRVRARLPRDMGLTMTALVSWCSEANGWMSGLPVDAAVPMYFRLGEHVGWWGVREPLCGGSVGVSTDEPWMAPELKTGKQVYVFAPRPWNEGQLAIVNRGGFPVDTRGVR
jgi:hypothetical protein